MARSFYEDLRSDDRDLREHQQETRTRAIDEENLNHDFNNMRDDEIPDGNSRITVTSDTDRRGMKGVSGGTRRTQNLTAWAADDEDVDEDVPASLLVENQTSESTQHVEGMAPTPKTRAVIPPSAGTASPETHRAQWEAVKRQQQLYGSHDSPSAQPYSMMAGVQMGGRKERALWRWVNTSSLDSFMRDVYNYYEGGGMWCILCSNALWLL